MWWRYYGKPSGEINGQEVKDDDIYKAFGLEKVLVMIYLQESLSRS